MSLGASPAARTEFFAHTQDCAITGQKLKKNLIFSPVVGPGMARVVLTWGGSVKDLDSFMLAP